MSEVSSETSSRRLDPHPPSLLSPPLRSPIVHNRIVCQLCQSRCFLMSRKHRICYDCFVGSLATAKVFIQGFDIRPTGENKICIICLNHSKFIGDKYLVCIDCLVRRLGDLRILKFENSEEVKPLFLALDNDISDTSDPVDWQRKKYYPCDICRVEEIEDHRKERICFNCIIDVVLETPYFIKQPRRIYFL